MGGIKSHGKGIQLTFWWNGQRHRPTLSIEATPRNLKYAENLLGEIKRHVSLGQYTTELYAKHFPTSHLARSIPKATESLTFTEAVASWKGTITHLAHGTKKKYINDIEFWIAEFGHLDVQLITFSLIAATANKMGWKAKHRNNMLTPLRQVLQMLLLDGKIDSNPAEFVKNAKVQKEPPDPFELAEVDLILNHIGSKYPEQARNYYEYMFFSGLRPEEAIALKWSDIDFRRGLVRIQRVRTAQVDEERTKTYGVRDVELNSRSLAALTRQKEHTFMKDEYVFHNPNTGRRWNSEQSQRRSYWIPSLKALGLRYRTQYQTRHTFATLNLMAGANPMWVSRQLGHKNMQMLLTTYSRWIDGADKSKERAKIEALFDSDSHKTATKTEKQA
jgi:integrase